MRRLLDRINNKDEKQQQQSIELDEILERESDGIDMDDQESLQDIKRIESQKAKLWLKNDFQSHLQVYAKSKYNKTINISAAAAHKVYKRMYEEKIRRNTSLSLYEKVLYHPDLTKIDYELITQQKHNVFRNAAIVEALFLGTMSYMYFKKDLKNKKYFFPFVTLGPFLVLYTTYAFESSRLIYKLRRWQFDTKYALK